jgi:hypothetical protein
MKDLDCTKCIHFKGIICEYYGEPWIGTVSCSEYEEKEEKKEEIKVSPNQLKLPL